MKTSLTPFAFGEHLVRTVERDGTPWFIATDVCSTLGILNPTQALAALDEDEKGLCLTYTPGGDQELLAVTESGLYHLVFKSRKPAAKAFRRWVTGEVLPAIRRTGSYSPAHQAYLGLLKEQIALGVPPALAARAALRLAPSSPASRYIAPQESARITGSSLDAVVSLMEEGRAYTPQELLGIIPTGHPILKGKDEKARLIRLGRHMQPYRKDGRIEASWEGNGVQRGGYIKYTRPRVVLPFSGRPG